VIKIPFSFAMNACSFGSLCHLKEVKLSVTGTGSFANIYLNVGVKGTVEQRRNLWELSCPRNPSWEWEWRQSLDSINLHAFGEILLHVTENGISSKDCS